MHRPTLTHPATRPGVRPHASLGVAALVSLAGCAAEDRHANELLVNGSFARGSQPWQSANTINVPGIFSSWRTTQGRAGAGSIEISADHTEPTSVPSWTCDIPRVPRGRSITITGYVKGVNVTGTPGFYARARSDARAPVLAEVGTETTQLPVGTFEWTPLTAVLAVPSEAASLEIQLFLRGPGLVWFDDLSVRVDPETTDDSPPR